MAARGARALIVVSLLLGALVPSEARSPMTQRRAASANVHTFLAQAPAQKVDPDDVAMDSMGDSLEAMLRQMATKSHGQQGSSVQKVPAAVAQKEQNEDDADDAEDVAEDDAGQESEDDDAQKEHAPKPPPKVAPQPAAQAAPRRAFHQAKAMTKVESGQARLKAEEVQAAKEEKDMDDLADTMEAMVRAAATSKQAVPVTTKASPQQQLAVAPSSLVGKKDAQTEADTDADSDANEDADSDEDTASDDEEAAKEDEDADAEVAKASVKDTASDDEEAAKEDEDADAEVAKEVAKVDPAKDEDAKDEGDDSNP